MSKLYQVLLTLELEKKVAMVKDLPRDLTLLLLLKEPKFANKGRAAPYAPTHTTLVVLDMCQLVVLPQLSLEIRLLILI